MIWSGWRHNSFSRKMSKSATAGPSSSIFWLMSFKTPNAAQWQIISSLADLQRGGSLFVVGDPKQSIYQFRGADVSVFNTVRDQIADQESGLALPLSTSFRSHRPLVEQFNRAFAEILVRDESSPVKDFEVVLDKPMQAFPP